MRYIITLLLFTIIISDSFCDEVDKKKKLSIGASVPIVSLVGKYHFDVPTLEEDGYWRSKINFNIEYRFDSVSSIEAFSNYFDAGNNKSNILGQTLYFGT